MFLLRQMMKKIAFYSLLLFSMVLSACVPSGQAVVPQPSATKNVELQRTPTQLTAESSPTVQPSPTIAPSNTPEPTLFLTPSPTAEGMLFYTHFHPQDSVFSDMSTYAQVISPIELLPEPYQINFSDQATLHFFAPDQRPLYALFTPDLGSSDLVLEGETYPNLAAAPFNFAFVCRYSPQGWYELGVQQGLMRWSIVLVKRNGQELERTTLAEGSSLAVHRNNNRVQARCLADSLDLTVNDSLMGSVKDTTFSASSLFGVVFQNPGSGSEGSLHAFKAGDETGKTLLDMTDKAYENATFWWAAGLDSPAQEWLDRSVTLEGIAEADNWKGKISAPGGGSAFYLSQPLALANVEVVADITVSESPGGFFLLCHWSDQGGYILSAEGNRFAIMPVAISKWGVYDYWFNQEEAVYSDQFSLTEGVFRLRAACYDGFMGLYVNDTLLVSTQRIFLTGKQVGFGLLASRRRDDPLAVTEAEVSVQDFYVLRAGAILPLISEKAATMIPQVTLTVMPTP